MMNAFEILAQYDSQRDVELHRVCGVRNQIFWLCYLDTSHYYEDFDYRAEGSGVTIEEAILAAFAQLKEKEDAAKISESE